MCKENDIKHWNPNIIYRSYKYTHIHKMKWIFLPRFSGNDSMTEQNITKNKLPGRNISFLWSYLCKGFHIFAGVLYKLKGVSVKKRRSVLYIGIYLHTRHDWAFNFHTHIFWVYISANSKKYLQIILVYTKHRFVFSISIHSRWFNR